MPEIVAQELTLEEFKPFGTFLLPHFCYPGGAMLGGGQLAFFPDLAAVAFPDNGKISFGMCVAGHRDLVVDATEFHTKTPEVLIPLEDVIIHVGPPTEGDQPPLDQIKAFRIPTGTVVILNEGVWHHGPFSADPDLALIWVLLPPRTYANDCKVVDLPEDSRIQITTGS